MRGNTDENLILTADVRELDFDQDFITPKAVINPLKNQKTSNSKTPMTLTNESCSEELTMSN